MTRMVREGISPVVIQKKTGRIFEVADQIYVEISNQEEKMAGYLHGASTSTFIADIDVTDNQSKP